MKNIFYILIAAFSLILHAKCVGQNNIVYGAGISYTNGAPAFVPPSKSARVAIDTVTSKWYEYATPGGWRWSGDRVQDISGCASPAYTPGKAQSRLVLNSCTEAQNGHGPELYKYTGSEWLCLNCGGNYTAGDGIDITGTEITNTAPDQVVSITGAGINAVTGTYPNFTVTGTEVDGSTTNELQTLSVAGSNLSISGGNTVTLPTPSSTLDALTDVTITSPTNAQILQYNTATTQWVNATLAMIAAGSSGQVQYNNAGSFGANSELLWNSTTKTLEVNRIPDFAYQNYLILGNNVSGVYGDIKFYIIGNGKSGVRLSTQSQSMEAYSTTNGAFFGSTTGASRTTVGSLLSSAGGPTYINFSTNGSSTGLHITHNNGSDLALIDNQGRMIVGSGAINTAAKFEARSTTGIMVPPNMTSTQRDAIATPPNGIIFNTTTGKFQGYAAGTWVDFH